MRHYRLIGALRKNLSIESNLCEIGLLQTIFFYFQNRGYAMQKVANYER